jgi:Transposase, Mutator family
VPRRSQNERPRVKWPYLRIDATYVKVREAGRIVSVVVTIAVPVSANGRCEVAGLAVGPSEAEPSWTAFLCALTRRRPCGVKLVIILCQVCCHAPRSPPSLAALSAGEPPCRLKSPLVRLVKSGSPVTTFSSTPRSEKCVPFSISPRL